MVMMLRPEGYRPRLMDQKLSSLLRVFGGVEVTGSKWTGKTWLGLNQAGSYTSLMEATAVERAKIDPALALLGEAPHLVDEWQEVPEIWDATRAQIDKDGQQKGQFILTGSTRPKDIDKVHHSGAGRIARLRLRPMTLSEMYDNCGGFSLSHLFDLADTGTEMPKVYRPTKVSEVIEWVIRGGWPASISLSAPDAALVPQQYLDALTEVTFVREGKSPAIARRLLHALAANTGSATKIMTLCRDMGDIGLQNDVLEQSKSGEGAAAENRSRNAAEAKAAPAFETVKSYLEELQRLFIIEGLPGWDPPLRSKLRLQTTPKIYFVDPSLPASILRATTSTLLRDTQSLGLLFETLVVRDLAAIVESWPGSGNRISYFRNAHGLEADVIIERDNGQWAAVEIKLSETVVDQKVCNRLKKVAATATDNPAAQVDPPAFLAVIVGRGEVTYQRPDGIWIIPAAALDS